MCAPLCFPSPSPLTRGTPILFATTLPRQTPRFTRSPQWDRTGPEPTKPVALTSACTRQQPCRCQIPRTERRTKSLTNVPPGANQQSRPASRIRCKTLCSTCTLELSVSSLRRGHANLLCIVPILTTRGVHTWAANLPSLLRHSTREWLHGQTAGQFSST